MNGYINLVAVWIQVRESVDICAKALATDVHTMLHETAMAWVRERLKKTVPRDPCSETVQAYGTRLKDVAVYINQHYDVDGLCRKLPKRVAESLDAKGDRLPH